jgi:hypothetical protein
MPAEQAWRSRCGVPLGLGLVLLGGCSLIVDPQRLPASTCTAHPAATLAAACPAPLIALDGTPGLPPSCAIATLTFRWVVRRPDGALTTLEGRGDQQAQGAFVSSGTFAKPTINPLLLQGGHAARTQREGSGANNQLFQTGFLLQPHTSYTLTLNARAEVGDDPITVYLQQHSGQTINYGLSGAKLALTSSWQRHTIPVTTNALIDGSATTDTRLRFQLGGGPGAVHWFDAVRLVQDGTQQDVLTNGDFEVSTTGWKAFFENGGSFTVEEYPTAAAGDYAITLEVIDDRLGSSGTAATAITLPACS